MLTNNPKAFWIQAHHILQLDIQNLEITPGYVLGKGGKALRETNSAQRYEVNVEGQQITDLTHCHIVDFLVLNTTFFHSINAR
jgi:hypothetical protein